MNVSIMFIIFLTSEALCLTSLEHTMNVGTVLFSPLDLRNSHWRADEIRLLRARRHFQGLLQPPNFIDTTNKEYVNTLLKFFKDTFNTIKREASCSVSDSLMTTAFSDAVGGYLKLWVLPITKLAFYGGTVSQENIIKLNQFYDEIKRFLKTDGSSWRNPDKTLLKAITVYITPHNHVVRSKEYPCESLSYYERTEDGMSIPIPYINWEDQAGTMFVPLRNQPLIPLNSPHYSNVLLKYYDVAKTCMDATSNSEEYDFDERFQNWLDRDVVPHLSDEQVYLPLGSVLSLMNDSDGAGNRFKQLYDPTFKSQTNTQYVIAGVPIDLKSKKFWIVAIFLTLEIIWCIPTLLYLIFSKRKRQECANIYTLLSSKCRSNTDDDNDNRDIEDNIQCECDECFSQDVKRNYKDRSISKVDNRFRSRNSEFKTQFLSQDSITSMTETSSVCSSVSAVHNVMAQSLKNIRTPQTLPPIHPAVADPSNSDKTRITVQKLNRPPRRAPKSRAHKNTCINEGNTERSRLEKQILKPLKHIISNSTFVFSTHKLDEIISADDKPLCVDENAPFCPCVTCSKESLQENSPCCPCEQCFEGDDSDVTVMNQATMANETYSAKNVETNVEFLHSRADKSTNVKQRKNVLPCLDINIDKPLTKISVGFAGHFNALKTHRQSKIPKRLPKTAQIKKELIAAADRMTTRTSPVKKETTHIRSMIPQPMRRAVKAVDDIVIKASKTKQKLKVTKFNVTL